MVMKRNSHLRSLVLHSVLALFAVTSSHAADPAEAKTIGRVIRERPDLSNFLQLLEKT